MAVGGPLAPEAAPPLPTSSAVADGEAQGHGRLPPDGPLDVTNVVGKADLSGAAAALAVHNDDSSMQPKNAALRAESSDAGSGSASDTDTDAEVEVVEEEEGQVRIHDGSSLAQSSATPSHHTTVHSLATSPRIRHLQEQLHFVTPEAGGALGLRLMLVAGLVSRLGAATDESSASQHCATLVSLCIFVWLIP